MNGVPHLMFKEVRGDVELRYVETHDFLDPDYPRRVVNAYFYARHIPSDRRAGIHSKHFHDMGRVPDAWKSQAVRDLIAAVTTP